jgi:hypothetical protein
VSEAAASPKGARLGSPSWLDGRLMIGVLLVLASVLVGAKVLAAADTSQRVWMASHDLAPGTVLAEGDLHLGRVRLFATSPRYVAGVKPVGYVVQRGISEDELLPVEALTAPGRDAPVREIAVPVSTGHRPPDLARGEQVDVYVTPDDKAVQRALQAKQPAVAAPRLVLHAVTVGRVVRPGGLGASSQEQPVVLDVDPSQVLLVLQALADGRIDLVRVPRSQQQPLVTATQEP